VQSLASPGPFAETLTGLWVVLVLSVGVRQVLLVSDNQTLRDGLERRVQEQTADLRRINRRTEVMLNSVGEGIYGVDLEGRITFSNPSALVTLGREPRDLMGRSAHDLLHAHAGPADGPEGHHDWSDCYIRQAMSEGEVVSSRADTYRRTFGTDFPVEVTASPLIDDDEILGAVVVFRDVTERREVDRMKDEFLSIVSHELRTPLTSIRGSLAMLSDGQFDQLPSPAQQMISIATRSSERLTRLINDILDVERIRSGKLRMECAPHEADHLVHSSTREMSSLAASGGVRIDVDRTEGWVLADPDRIVQTLTNILGNAIKFSGAGSTVRVEAVTADREVVFSVVDEGRGVPQDKLSSIFDPFEQVDSTDSREKGGTGLGLAICRGIVERHGGRIWAESEPGVGTTVRFTLPRSAAPTSGGVVSRLGERVTDEVV
jgi:PAS domain S-box-containing protein